MVEDIRSTSITITREELAYALQGATCEVHDAKEEILTQLQASQGAPAPATATAEASSSRDMARELKFMQRQLQKMEEQLACKSFQCIEHPNSVLPPPLHAVLLVIHALFAEHFFMTGAVTTYSRVDTCITSHV